MPLIAMTREMGRSRTSPASQWPAGKLVVHHETSTISPTKCACAKAMSTVSRRQGQYLERFTTDKTSLSIYTADETIALAESASVSVIHGWGSAHLLRRFGRICVRVCAPMKYACSA
jgi:hypothetical protein